MKVLQIVRSLNIGGLEVLVLQLAKQLREQGVELDICCVEQPGELADSARDSGIDVFSLNKGRGLSLRAAILLRKRLRTKGYDVLHTHNPAAHIYGGMAALGVSIPLVHTNHQMLTESRWKRLLLPRILARSTSRFVAVSEPVRQSSVAEFRVPEARIEVVCNGIALEPFDSLVEPLGFPGSQLTIGTVGRLTPLKNHALLIEAFGILLKRFPHAKLRIVGDGECRRELEVQIDALSLGEHVELTGMRNDIPAELEQMDIFVLSSNSEGMPLAIIEAMAARRPIIATKVGGLPEMLGESEAGILVEAGNANQLADAMTNLCSNPATAVRLGLNGRLVAEARYSIEQMAKNYQKIYAGVARQAP